MRPLRKSDVAGVHLPTGREGDVQRVQELHGRMAADGLLGCADREEELRTLRTSGSGTWDVLHSLLLLVSP